MDFNYSYKMSGGFDGCNEYSEDMAMDQNSRQEQHAADMVSISSDMCEAELTTTPPPPQQQQPVDGVGCPCSFNGIHAVLHPEQTPMMMMHQEQAAAGDKRKRTDEPVADSDEHFALSCVAALRRLPMRKNAEMRMRILHMLYEAEYGEEPMLR